MFKNTSYLVSSVVGMILIEMISMGKGCAMSLEFGHPQEGEKLVNSIKLDKMQRVVDLSKYIEEVVCLAVIDERKRVELVKILCQSIVDSHLAIFASRLFVQQSEEGQRVSAPLREYIVMLNDIVNHKGYKNSSYYKSDYFFSKYKDGWYKESPCIIDDSLADLKLDLS